MKLLTPIISLCIGLISTTASASVTYNVNILGSYSLGSFFLSSPPPSGPVILTGTITTDGATGLLHATDITAFDLNVSGNFSVSVSSATQGFTCPLTACELQAVGSQLIASSQGLNAPSEIDFGVTDTARETNAIRFVSDPSYQLTQTIIYYGMQPYVVTNLSSGGELVVGNAVSAVPIPSATWLLGSGIIGLVGVIRKRKTT